MKKRILQGIGGAGLFFLAIAALIGVGQISFGGTVTKPHTFSAGQTIKSSEINANYDAIFNEFNGSISNANISASAAIAPSKIDDYSATVSQMQTTVDPGDVGTESQATSIQGEIERLRFKIKQIIGGAQWYSDTPIAKASIPSAVAYEDEANTFTAAPLKLKVSPDTTGIMLYRAAADNYQIRTNDDGAGNQEDATKPSWTVALQQGASDNLEVFRRPAGGGYASLLRLDNTGKMTVGIVPLARIDGFTGSVVWDPTSLGAHTGTSTNVTVSGAAEGDFVLLSSNANLADTTLAWQAYVIPGGGTVRISVTNTTTGTIDPSSRTLYLKVIKKDF